MNRLEPQTGAGFELKEGDLLAVVDPTGGQVSDLFAVSADDTREWLSSGRTIDYANCIYQTTNDLLYSNRSRPMLRIIEDDCGRHDFTLTPCSQQTFDLLYPEFHGERHPSCLENLATSLAPYDVTEDQIGTSFNIFMNVWTDDNGIMHIDPPRSKPGDRFVVEAQMDLFVALTACSAEKSNGGICKPIDYAIVPRQEDGPST